MNKSVYFVPVGDIRASSLFSDFRINIDNIHDGKCHWENASIDYYYLTEAEFSGHKYTSEQTVTIQSFLSEMHIKKLNETPAKLIFDCMKEVPVVYEIQKLLKSKVIPFGKLVIIVSSERSRKIINAMTRREFRRNLSIININYFEYIVARTPVVSLTTEKDKKFNLLIRNVDELRYFRILLFIGLIRDRLLDDSDVSFYGRNPYSNIELNKSSLRNILENNSQHNLSVYGCKNLDKIMSYIPRTLEEDDGNIYDAYDGPYKTFARSVFSVTVETHFHYEYHLTEKTFKPIAMKMPFIMFAGPGALRDLRRMGYKTFHPFINELYDEEQDDLKRFDMILKEIRRLNAMPIERLIKHFEPINDILEHNYDNLMKRKHDPFKNTHGLKELLLYE